MAEGKASPWVWVGIGCLVVALLLLATCGVGGWFAVKRAREFGESMKDPQARAASAREVLGVETLPEGYHPVVAFSAPFGLMKVAILGDRPPGPDGGPRNVGGRGLIYVEFPSLGRSDQQGLRDYLEGRTDDPAVLERHNISIDQDEIIKRGVVRVDGAELLYVAQRGSIASVGGSGSEFDIETDSDEEGITSIVLVDCGDERRRTRMAIWFGPDPSPASPVAELDLTGTPADERALGEFLGQFALCR